jgi:SlyX protein
MMGGQDVGSPGLDELETRLAFLDDLVSQLNEVVARQDRELMALYRRVDALETRMNDLLEVAGLPGDPSGHEVPPHY